MKRILVVDDKVVNRELTIALLKRSGRQAVEAFVHHPLDGQVMRLTEWF